MNKVFMNKRSITSTFAAISSLSISQKNEADTAEIGQYSSRWPKSESPPLPKSAAWLARRAWSRIHSIRTPSVKNERTRHEILYRHSQHQGDPRGGGPRNPGRRDHQPFPD